MQHSAIRISFIKEQIVSAFHFNHSSIDSNILTIVFSGGSRFKYKNFLMPSHFLENHHHHHDCCNSVDAAAGEDGQYDNDELVEGNRMLLAFNSHCLF